MSKFKNAVRKIAEKRGISQEEVYREMQFAIDIGYCSPDPTIRAAWNDISPNSRPKPEDIYRYILNKIQA